MLYNYFVVEALSAVIVARTKNIQPKNHPVNVAQANQDFATCPKIIDRLKHIQNINVHF